jgi:hypothetical protein
MRLEPRWRWSECVEPVEGANVARPVWFGEVGEPRTESQLWVRAAEPELVWLAHEHEPWRLHAM